MALETRVAAPPMGPLWYFFRRPAMSLSFSDCCQSSSCLAASMTVML